MFVVTCTVPCILSISGLRRFVSSKVLGYVKLAVNEGGEIVCGEGKDSPLELPNPHTEVGTVLFCLLILMWRWKVCF